MNPETKNLASCTNMFTFLFTRPRLFKRWIALSTGRITIQRRSITEINYAIPWIVIYPVDSAIQRLDNRGQKYNILSTEDSTRHFSTI